MKKTSTKTKSPAKKEIKENSFPVVAIGASAGGLEAMMELLKYLPANTGMAFIYVQHLSPDHKSMLTEILSKKTTMKVQEIDDMDKIKPDNVFVIPNNKGIEVTDGHIKLIPRSESSAAITIDILFSSLARAQKERVIGIVLSGSASDGALGIKNIKQEGGLTFAQDDTAKFTSMPQSAIATGLVDFILSPKEIALELARLSNHPLIKTNGEKNGEEDLIDNSHPDLKTILNQLQGATGVDFAAYKMNTIKRRIIRRMLLYKIKTLKEYAKLLATKNEEINILYQDLLISVTSFFRDTETHKYLKESLFPKLLKRKKNGESLRIWVPACASGEEAYSIAMILLELQGSLISDTPVQIFATDLSENAIGKARIGLYSKQELATVSPKRLQHFFTKVDGSYRVNKVVRDICVFAPHNVLRDPPFSRLDFISCCNLFIYFDSAAQKKVVNTFHYALNNDGFLMLGNSENISQSTNLFTASNKKYKIFVRKPNSGTRHLPELLPRHTHHTKSGYHSPIVPRKTQQIFSSFLHNELDNAIDAVLIADFMPASVVINHQMEIVQFRGTTDLFLTHPKGRATFNILKMARPEIAFEIRNAISKVIKTNNRFGKSGIELKINSKVRIIRLEIVPLKIQSNDPLILILFTEQEQAEIYSQEAAGGKTNSIVKDRRIKKLEEELLAAQADTLTISQEQEAFAEELQSANEEVVSSNEELQTVNEELETSKEEIESANEELSTTNQELQTRNDLLNESYEYSEAIVSTMHEPMLVLSKDFRVKTANKPFYKKFGVIEDQTEGVLLYDLGNKQWNIPALRELIEDIIPKNSQFLNYEVKHTFPHLGEKIMSLNASRIIQKTHREHLILLVISDITEVRQLQLEKELQEQELHNKEIERAKTEKAFGEKLLQEEIVARKKIEESEKKFKELAELMPQKVWTADAKGKKTYFNQTFIEYTGYSLEEIKGWAWKKIVHPDDFEENEKKWKHSIATGTKFEVENRFRAKDGKYLWHLTLAVPLKNESGKIISWIGTKTEIQEQKNQKAILEKAVEQRTSELHLANTELQHMNKELEAFTYVSSHDLQEPLRKIQTFASHILEKENANISESGKNYFRLMQSSAARMQTLIHDLLVFSRLSALDRKFEITDLNIIIAEVKNELKEAIAEKHAVIEVTEICEAHIIPFQFRQLMHNLLSNSLKFSNPKIPPHITISSTNVKYSKKNMAHLTPGEEYCHITISDNGIGFEKEFSEKIFEVFQRLHGKDEYLGTGIGLAIVKKIVDNHNGIITATSELNKGAKFEIYIPA